MLGDRQMQAPGTRHHKCTFPQKTHTTFMAYMEGRHTQRHPWGVQSQTQMHMSTCARSLPMVVHGHIQRNTLTGYILTERSPTQRNESRRRYSGAETDAETG